jgi:uncharacterized membrane-anchored protein YhcB (DUF1043 family)
MYFSEILLIATIGGTFGGIVFVYMSNRYKKSLTEKEIELIKEFLHKQESSMSKKLGEILKDFKKMEDDIDELQEKLHSQLAPTAKDAIFSEYKNNLKNHEDKLQKLQTRIDSETDLWFLLNRPESRTSDILTNNSIWETIGDT